MTAAVPAAGLPMTCKQRTFLVCCLLAITCGQMSFAVISPFFPLEAPRLGLSTEMVALVFGVMPLAMLLASPVAGPLATAFGRRTVLSAGALLLTLGGTSFGVGSALTPGSTLLIGLLLCCRVFQGVGSALMVTCLFAVLADCFPHSKGKVMGLAEMAGGLGWSIAPPLGGVLYSSGGFVLPFIVLGPLPLLILVPILLLMPRRPALSDATQSRRPTIHGGAWVRMRRLLTPGLVVSAFLAMVPFLSWATLDLGLTVWLTGPPHDLSVVGATGIFTLIPAGYFFGSLGFGWATDMVQEKKLLIAVGLWATGAMYVLFWPGWYRLVAASHDVEVATIGILCGVLGLSFPAVMVPCLPDMHHCRQALPSPPTPTPDSISSDGDGDEAALREHEEHCLLLEEDATNLISALYTTMMNLGGALGPFIGAATIKRVGFPVTVALFGGAHILLGCLLTAGVLLRRRRRSGEKGVARGAYAQVAMDEDADVE
eukprot:COSAG05_NODE_1044_length_6057_cov_9.395267_5_plen_485_part_00